MKNLILLFAAALTLSSFAAAGRPTTPGEARLVCQALDRAMEKEQADAAVRMDECVAAQGTARHLDETRTEVKLPTPMYVEGRKTTETCTLVYLDRSAHARNIEGGDTNVSCE
jgi:hypothetical protein